MRAFPGPIFPASRPARLEPQAAPQDDTRSTLLLVVPETDVHLYPGQPFTRISALSMTAALQQLARNPTLVVIDWDFDAIEGIEVCRAAVTARARVLVATADPAIAPLAIKAGAHALLLKPFAPMLASARLGRLARGQAPSPPRAGEPVASGGAVNRVCREIRCPYCAAGAPTSFEFSSYRRAWFACLSCDRVWLGPRLE